MIRRSAAVAVAVTLHQLIAGKASGWTPDQELVLAALRRSAARLHGASDAELGDYSRPMSSVQVQGVASNLKGILHEMLVMQAENADGDDILAQLFEATNHPGADLEFVMDGDVVGDVQLKAVQDPGAIIEHFHGIRTSKCSPPQRCIGRSADFSGQRGILRDQQCRDHAALSRDY